MTLALKAFAWLVFGFLIMALPLFLAAGTIAWPAGWLYLILLYGWLCIGILLLLKYNPGLLAERINVSAPNQKAWDKVFVLLLNVFIFASLVLMALDAVRFHWSWMPLWLQMLGAIALLVSFILMSLVFRENSYLSATVRIQEERGQTVISTGPYHYVRHPMYAGGLFMFLGTPLLLGSWYGVRTMILETVYATDTHFVKVNIAGLSMDRARVLTHFHQPQEARQTLAIAQHHLGTELTRWQSRFLIADAEVYLAENDAPGCCEVLFDALKMVRAANSRSNERRIETLHEQLMVLYPHHTLVNQLGAQLHSS